jgi:HSP20 family protein
MFSKPSSAVPDWSTPLEEGQLSLDVFRDGKYLVIRSTVAGAKPEDIDIGIHGDLLTVRGKRVSERDVKEEDWYYRECYWGAFSRSIVLPYEVNAEKAEASMKNGVLEIKIPIREAGEKSIKVKVEE